MGEGLFQPMHLIVIAVVALLVFGPKKLPELGKGLAEGIKGFKDGMKDTPAATPTANAPAVKTTTVAENKMPETKIL